MTTEQNKALVRQLVEEVFRGGNVERLDTFLAADFVEHEEMPPGVPAGGEGVKVLIATLHAAFPDFDPRIDDLIAEGDRVVIRMTWSGTQRGEFMGIPPTGRHVSFGVIDILRLVDGKCVEHWGQMDSMGLMQQLGAMPQA